MEFKSVFLPIADLPPSVMPSAHVMPNYLSQDDDRGGPRVVKDTKSIGSAYDRYLQNVEPFKC